MDEQLKKLLLDAAQKGINGVEQTIDWVATQAPDLLEQLVMYNLITSLVWIVLGIAAFIFSIIFFKKRIFVKTYDEGPQVLIPIIAMIVAIPAIYFNITTFIKCLVAPKLFIFEYLSSLLN